ncbi:MAG: phosphorylase, partial [Dolichospermum sp.]
MPTLILVPQGAEHQAVCRGLNPISSSLPQVLTIPMGIAPVQQYLHNLTENLTHACEDSILMMGLCGSLSGKYQVGDIVLYQSCFYQGHLQECHNYFTADIYARLGNHVSLVKGLTSDRIVCTSAEKHHLHQQYGTDVVDMEAYPFLEFFRQFPDKQVAILRVVSDDSHHDIPNIASAISENGSLRPFPLAWEFIRQPQSARRLITGSLQGLKVLTAVTQLLFT